MQARIAIGCTAVLSLILIVGVAVLRWSILPLYVPISDVANILAPLILTAAFIERAVEVVVSPFRDPGADELRHQLAVLQATNPIDSNRIADAQKHLNAYKAESKKYAFCALLLLGLCAAVVGIRALGLFLIQAHPVPPGPQIVPVIWGPGQNGAFCTIDVIISALLLAGGANGLHAPINAFTSFFNTSADKSLKTGATPPGAPSRDPNAGLPTGTDQSTTSQALATAAQAQSTAAQAQATAAQAQAAAAQAQSSDDSGTT